MRRLPGRGAVRPVEHGLSLAGGWPRSAHRIVLSRTTASSKEITMANEALPSYLASAKPNPMANRGPWYANIAPSYAGIFLWIAFYDQLPEGLRTGGVATVLLGLVLAGLISHFLFYYVFGLLGMKTGLPLYVVGSSTFGTKGGYLFPGIFMGLLQIGWYSVATFYSAKLVLEGLELERHTMTVFDPELKLRGFSVLFVVVAAAWGYIFAFIGALGVKYVARMSQFFPIVPIVMLIVAAVSGASGIGKFEPNAEHINTAATIGLMIQMVVGFFATAGAAGVDFGTAARNSKDVSLGGLLGIALAVLFTGGLATLTVAGAHGMNPAHSSYVFREALSVVNPDLAKWMKLLFAVGSMAPACFCASIIGNSLSTMIPSLPRVGLTLGGATIGIALAALGIAGNLGAFFGLIGASFGPICGAIVADYLLSGKKWAGPREGISIAGYAAWVVGFVVGISNNGMVTALLKALKAIPESSTGLLPGWQPTAVYSFIVGFIVYAVLASVGLKGKPVALPAAATASAQ
jgi:cytosine permease